MKRILNGGYSLIEALVSLVIVSIVVVGAINFYGYGKEIEAMTVHKKIAVETLNSRMEFYRRNLDELPAIGSEETIANVWIDTLPATEKVKVDYVDENGDESSDWEGSRKVTINLDWTEPAQGGKNISIQFDTYL